MTEHVSANPSAMRTYVEGVRGTRQDAYDARTRVVNAYDDFAAALPPEFPAPPRPDIAGALGRVRDMDNYLTSVADTFERAGTSGEGGVFTLDAAALGGISYTSAYDEERRERLRQRAEEELARIRENLGTADGTTLGEMAAVLGWMEFEISKGTTPEEKHAIAAGLIDTMGAGDLQQMLALLEGELDDGADPDTIQSYLRDLAGVVSWGLEGNDERADRWVQQLSEAQDWYHDGPPQMLIALGALVAPGTSTLGLSIWQDLRDHPGQHEAPSDGPLEQILGSNNSIEVLADSASRRPELANAIVMDTISRGPDGFEQLFAQGGDNVPLGGDSTYDALGAMLTASVDPSLPLEARLLAASQTMTMYDHVLNEGPVYFYADPIREALGTMTQPLLANLTPDGSHIWLPGTTDPLDPGNPSTEHLENVVKSLANDEAGLAGLARAVEGATVEYIYRADDRAAASIDTADPLNVSTLDQAGEMVDWMVTTVGREKLDALVEAVEGGGWEAGLQTAIVDGLGASEFEPLAAVISTVDAYAGQEVVADGSVLRSDAEVRLTYNLAVADLAARPELLSPELDRALQEAGSSGGEAGIYNLLYNDRLSEADYPGLHELRELVHEQMAHIGESSLNLAQVFDVG